jgi:hypothetical protein
MSDSVEAAQIVDLAVEEAQLRSDIQKFKCDSFYPTLRHLQKRSRDTDECITWYDEAIDVFSCLTGYSTSSEGPARADSLHFSVEIPTRPRGNDGDCEFNTVNVSLTFDPAAACCIKRVAVTGDGGHLLTSLTKECTASIQGTSLWRRQLRALQRVLCCVHGMTGTRPPDWNTKSGKCHEREPET